MVVQRRRRIGQRRLCLFLLILKRSRRQLRKTEWGLKRGERTWVDVEEEVNGEEEMSEEMTVEVDADGKQKRGKVASPKRIRYLTFFANNHYYVLVRLVQVSARLRVAVSELNHQIIYSRLLECKTHAASLSASKTQPINPIAIELGLAEPDTHFMAIEAGENPSQQYYGHLLGMAERLFEGDIDANLFEENLRIMFGTKAYVMFTLDRVIASIVKQVRWFVLTRPILPILRLPILRLPILRLPLPPSAARCRRWRRGCGPPRCLGFLRC